MVLHRTQDVVNLAGTVRAMKNFELRDLRLVSPCEYDAYHVEGIAHKSGDILKRAEVFSDLDAALADCTHVVGLTARQRSAKRNTQRPREAALEILTASTTGRVALVFGPEDKGLTNEELDRCHRVVIIPTSSRYPSLNLAHAVSLMAYEIFQVRGSVALKRPRRVASMASREQLERLFHDAERALSAIDFLKTRHPPSVMRTVREIVHRTPIDAREVELLRAMCIEVARFLERAGVRP